MRTFRRKKQIFLEAKGMHQTNGEIRTFIAKLFAYLLPKWFLELKSKMVKNKL